MIKELLSIRLRRLLVGPIFRADGSGKRSGVKIALGILLYVFLLGSLLLMSISFAASLSLVLVANGLDWLYFLVYILATFTFLFVFGIFESKAELFECKDNGILIPLPIKARDIVISRMLVLLLYHYFECAIIFIPAIVFYVLFGGTPLAIIGGTVVLLLLPLLTASLSSVLGFLLAKVTARVKNKTFYTLLFTVAFLVLYFLGYSSLINGMDAFFENMESVMIRVSDALTFLRPIGEIALLRPIPLVIFLVLCPIVSYFVMRLVARFYFSVATGMDTAASVLRTESTSKTRPPFLALIQKELRRFFSSATYMVQCGIGLLMSLLLGILAIVKRSELLLFAGELALDLSDATSVGTAILCMLLTMNFMSGVALSLEGKSLWVVRSLPVSSRDILLSKALCTVVVNAPFSLVASTLLTVALRPRPLGAISLFVIPLVASAAAGAFYTVFNVLVPKLDFENEVAVLKQSASAFVGSIGSMLVGFVFVALSFFLSILSLGWLSHLLLLFFSLAVGSVSFALLCTVMPKKLDKM